MNVLNFKFVLCDLVSFIFRLILLDLYIYNSVSHSSRFFVIPVDTRDINHLDSKD